jgi:hypothetical protein
MTTRTAYDLFRTADGARKLVTWFRYAALGVIGAAVAVVWHGGQEEWLNRAGALLTMVSLGLTYFQFRYELQTETARTSRVDNDRWQIEQMGVTGSKLDQILRRDLDQESENREKIRSMIFMNSLVIAVFGEFLHGFGDWLWKAVQG